MTPSTIRVSISELHQFCCEVLLSAKVSSSHARITAEALTTTDSFGVFTHGTKLLNGYLRRLKAGGIRFDGEPKVIREGPAWAIVDGASTLGQVIGDFAMKIAVQKARQCGISYVGVNHSNHFGAAGYYTLLAAKEGLIGLAMCNDIPSVAAPGSRGAIFGTNPLAYAIPTGNGNPIFLDIATSTAAGGKVYMSRTLGKPIPPDWLIDANGKPTTDGSLYPDKATLAPMAGHKGYGLGLLIESLSGILSSAAITWQVGNWMWGDLSKPTNHGAAFLAIDVSTICSPEEFYSRIQKLINEIHTAPTAEGIDRLLLPGEREWANRERSLKEGIALPPDVVEKLIEAANQVNLRPEWLIN